MQSTIVILSGFYVKYSLIYLLSSVKFAMTFPVSVFAEELSPVFVYFLTTLGGISGAIFFVFLWGKLLFYLRRFQFMQFRRQRPVFSKRSRRLAYIKSTYGFWGLVVLTPVLFSIPLGALILAAYYPNKRKIIRSLSITIACWSLIMVTVLFTFREILMPYF